MEVRGRFHHPRSTINPKVQSDKKDILMRKTIYSPAYRRFVRRLRRARREHAMTQAQVGRKLGVSRHWVAKAESCQVRLDVVQFVTLCRVYNLNASRLFSRLAEELSDEDGSSLAIGNGLHVARHCPPLRMSAVFLATPTRKISPSGAVLAH